MYVINAGFNQTLCCDRQGQIGSSIGGSNDEFLHRMHFITRVSRNSLKCDVTYCSSFLIFVIIRREIRDVCEPGRAEELFRSVAKNDSQNLDFEDFKKLIPSKNVRSTIVALLK